MMKKAIYTFVLFFFVPCFMMAQVGSTVQYACSNPDRDPSPNSNGATVTLDYHATSGGRHSYRYILQAAPLVYLEVIYRNSRWEIHLFVTGDANELWFISTVQSTPNPPNLTFGNWKKENGVTPHDMSNFSGTSTQSALPVELITFNATTEKGTTLLTWATATETNNAGFDIERNTDGVRFEKIGFVAGSGTTQQQQDYSFTDASRGGTTYYRLKQLDFDGAFEHSKIISVAQDGKNTVQVSPNPSHGMFSITGIDAAEAETFTVMNNMGQVVSTTIQRDGQLDMSAFPSGVYYLRVASSGQVVKLVKS